MPSQGGGIRYGVGVRCRVPARGAGIIWCRGGSQTRPPGGVMVHVHVKATHMGINRGPVICGWRAACMPPLHYPTSPYGHAAACPYERTHRRLGETTPTSWMPLPADNGRHVCHPPRVSRPTPQQARISVPLRVVMPAVGVCPYQSLFLRPAGTRTPGGRSDVWGTPRARRGIPGTTWTPQPMTFGNGVPAIKAGHSFSGVGARCRVPMGDSGDTMDTRVPDVWEWCPRNQGGASVPA